MQKLIGVFIIISLSVCCNKKNIPADSGKGITPAGFLFELRKDPYEVIYIKRTSCFGKCPAYEAMFLSDGKVFYKGKANVEKVGSFQSSIDPAKINVIIKKAFELKYFDMAEKYPESGEKLSDLPTTVTSVNCTGQSKTINNSYRAPDNLKKFEDLIDSELDKLKFVTVEPGNIPVHGQ